MNKVIVAGDTLGAAVKISLALGVVYAVYKAYSFSGSVEADYQAAKQETSDFFTKTVNPASKDNFINDSVIGDFLTPGFNTLFEALGVGE